MLITATALTALIHRCAPDVRPSTMAAIVQVESGGNPYAFYDNTTGHRYTPDSKRRAISILSRLVRAGHQVDAGLAQIDSENFRRYGLTPASVFDACRNLGAGAAIFRSGYRMAVRAGLSGQPAVYHAFEAYNSGRLYGDARYADAVLRAAGLPVSIEPGVYRLEYHHLPANAWHGSPFVTAWKPSGAGAESQGGRFAAAWSVR